MVLFGVISTQAVAAAGVAAMLTIVVASLALLLFLLRRAAAPIESPVLVVRAPVAQSCVRVRSLFGLSAATPSRAPPTLSARTGPPAGALRARV